MAVLTLVGPAAFSSETFTQITAVFPAGATPIRPDNSSAHSLAALPSTFQPMGQLSATRFASYYSDSTSFGCSVCRPEGDGQDTSTGQRQCQCRSLQFAVWVAQPHFSVHWPARSALHAASAPTACNACRTSATPAGGRGACGGRGRPTSYPCRARPPLIQAARL